MEPTNRSGNSKYSTGQITTPKITKLRGVGVYTEYSDCWIRLYNPNAGASKISVYNGSKDALDEGESFAPGYVEFISIPKGWTLEIMDNSLEVTVTL